MTSLKELRESFQRGILASDDAILAEIQDSAKEERKMLFNVYRHAYVARLAEVLADDPCLSRRCALCEAGEILYPSYLRDQRHRPLVRIARKRRPACGVPAAGAASYSGLAAGRDRALPAAWPRGGDDVGNEAPAGTCFGVLCAMVATYGGEDGADFRATSYLKDWIDMETPADCRLAS
jgi:hypothetical protein